jgi:hypothetical protein
VSSAEALLVLSNQRSFLEKISRATIDPQAASSALPLTTETNAV